MNKVLREKKTDNRVWSLLNNGKIVNDWNIVVLKNVTNQRNKRKYDVVLFKDMTRDANISYFEHKGLNEFAYSCSNSDKARWRADNINKSIIEAEIVKCKHGLNMKEFVENIQKCTITNNKTNNSRVRYLVIDLDTITDTSALHYSVRYALASLQDKFNEIYLEDKKNAEKRKTGKAGKTENQLEITSANKKSA